MQYCSMWSTILLVSYFDCVHYGMWMASKCRADAVSNRRYYTFDSDILLPKHVHMQEMHNWRQILWTQWSRAWWLSIVIRVQVTGRLLTHFTGKQTWALRLLVKSQKKSVKRHEMESYTLIGWHIIIASQVGIQSHCIVTNGVYSRIYATQIERPNSFGTKPATLTERGFSRGHKTRLKFTDFLPQGVSRRAPTNPLNKLSHN